MLNACWCESFIIWWLDNLCFEYDQMRKWEEKLYMKWLNLIAYSLVERGVKVPDLSSESISDDEVTEVELPSDAKERSEIIRAKVWTVARLNKMYSLAIINII